MPRNAVFKRTVVLMALTALVILGCAVPALIQAGRKFPRNTAAKKCKVRIAWKIRAGGVRAVSFTPGDKYFYTLSGENRLSLYSIAGKPVYAVDLPGMDRLVSSPDARFAVAYSHLDPANTNVVFLDSFGHSYWKMRLSGAVWSADACVVDDGCRFVVGTGDKRVYVFDLDKSGRRYRWWRAPGAVVSISLEQGGQGIVYGTWQDSLVTRANIDGTKTWQAMLDTASLHYVERLNTNDRFALRSIPNRRGASAELCIMDAAGNSIWKRTLDASSKTKALCSPDGQYVCLGYINVIEHKGKTISEKHAVLLDDSGQSLWEQGSMFFQADPLLVTPGGEVLLHNGKGALFIMREKGTLDPCLKLQSTITGSVVSRDARALLLLCSDGTISKVEVSY